MVSQNRLSIWAWVYTPKTRITVEYVKNDVSFTDPTGDRGLTTLAFDL